MGSGRVKLVLLVLLYLLAIGFAAVETRDPNTPAVKTTSGSQ